MSLLLLSGCAPSGPQSSYEDGEVLEVDQEAAPAGISMECEWTEYALTAPRITFLVTNNTEEEFMTGCDFELEVYLGDGTWNTVPMKENYGFTAEGIILAPGTARAFGGVIAEIYYSYLVTDGTDLYLSNVADWDASVTYPGSTLFLLLSKGSADADLVTLAEEMTACRLESNVTRYKVWSPDGTMFASLTENPTRLSMGGLGYGTAVDLQGYDGLETAILDVAWDGETVLLACETLEGTGHLRATLEKEPLRITIATA